MKRKCEDCEFEQLKTVLGILCSWLRKHPFRWLKYTLFLLSLINPGQSGLEQKSVTLTFKGSFGGTFKFEGTTTDEGTAISEGPFNFGGTFQKKIRRANEE